MHKTLPVIATLSLFATQIAVAGPLYGTVRIAGGAATGLTLVVACPGFGNPGHKISNATTDRSGSFSMLVTASGRCEMRVQRGGQSGQPFPVFVSNNPLKFDFSIDGALNAVR